MSTLTMPARLGAQTGAGAPVRLTRRGRLLALMLLVAALLTAAVALGPSVVATSQPGQPVPVRTVVVQPGETLWQIAARADRSGNVGDMVHRIAELNALPSTGELQIGQRIAVPIE